MAGSDRSDQGGLGPPSNDASGAPVATEASPFRAARELFPHLTAGDRSLRMDAYDALEAFQACRGDPAQALRRWFGNGRASTLTLGTAALLLARDMAQIDALLNEQVNAIIHHERFRRLEGSWRGLLYLVDQSYLVRDREAQDVKIRVLDVSWKALARDLERAIEFDQSQFWKKVYDEEFGAPGGEPYGALLGDYEVAHRPRAGHTVQDLDALTAISHVAAAAFAPFVVGASPALLGLDRFADLERPIDLERTFAQVEYARWKSLRKGEDSRYVGIVLPRVLARLPYRDDVARADGFRFEEQVDDPDGTGYVWTTAVYAFGSVLIRSFAESGWLASIRGVPEGGQGGGVVNGLSVHSFATDRLDVATKYSTDVLVTDEFEKELSDHGLIALCPLKYTTLSAFYGNTSIQLPERYDDDVADANARMSAMLQYMFCCGQFAHYIKVLGRDRIGSMKTATECQNALHDWLMQYTTANDGASLATKARYPLREALVQVREVPGKPGVYSCVVHLKPHFQLDQAVSAVKIVTELSPVSK